MPVSRLPDDLLTQRIVEAVRAGASRTAAAEAARVARSTLLLWLRRGAAGEEPYASFAMRVREAEGELEKELITIIKGHAATTFAAAAWLCERRWPARWALRRPEAKPETVSAEEQRRLIADAAAIHAELLKTEEKS